MVKILIAATKSWNIKNAEKFKSSYADRIDTSIINSEKELTFGKLSTLQPEYVFFPHWSWIIPKEIYDNYVCIVFHMTDLPFGRGGSPLQNLVVRGVENTKISALRVTGELDAGGIYMKEPLNLNGTAEEIYMRASDVIFDRMIPGIIFNSPTPFKQTGEVVSFKRRKEEDGELMPQMDMKIIFDHIRMLDAEGYPRAFITFGRYKLSFSRASLKSGRILADVEITGGDGI